MLAERMDRYEINDQIAWTDQMDDRDRDGHVDTTDGCDDSVVLFAARID